MEQDTAEIQRNDVKYGGWSVILALTQGQPGLHWEPVSKGKEKRYEFSNFYGWLGMEDFPIFMSTFRKKILNSMNYFEEG